MNILSCKLVPLVKTFGHAVLTAGGLMEAEGMKAHRDVFFVKIVKYSQDKNFSLTKLGLTMQRHKPS